MLYDPAKVTYEELLEVFWMHVDPTDGDGQFVDRGSQYRSVIFYANEQERSLAEASKKRLAASGRFDKPIATDILPLGPFYPSEEYHQDYYKKNPIRYHWYRNGSGRDQFLKKAWKDKESDMEPQAKVEMKSDMKDEMKETRMTPDKMKEKMDGGMTTSNMEAKQMYERPNKEELRQR